MPPKTFKRQTVPTSISGSAQKRNEKQEAEKDFIPNNQELFVNSKTVIENKKAFDKMRLLTTILAGVVSGLLNLNQLQGPFLYLAGHLLLTVLIFFKIGKGQQYFKSVGSLFQGMGGGVLLFICIWMIVVNVVYVL